MASQPNLFCALVKDRVSKLDIICWRIMIWVMGLATPLIMSLKPRRFIVGEIDVIEQSADLSQLIGWGLAFICLLLVCIAIFRRFLIVDWKKARHGHARNFWLLTLLLAAMPLLSTIVTGGTLSRSGILGTVILYSATYFLPTPPFVWWVREVRVMLLFVFVYGSLVAAILFPQWAWDLDYATESTIAILPLRLFGVAEHANALAPLVIFAWILGRFPSSRLPGEFIHGGAIILVLFLTQSKTNWIIALILLIVQIYKKFKCHDAFKRYLIYFVSLATFAIGLLYFVKYSSYSSSIEDVLYDPQVFTLTGRLPLWIFAVEMWLERPWLGQGLDAWSSKAVLEYVDLLGWGATHAHNQVLQILSQSGLIGLSVFIIWIKYLWRIIRSAPTNIRIPFKLLTLVFFLPCLTELVLQYGLGKASTLRTWLYYTIVLFIARASTSKVKKEILV